MKIEGTIATSATVSDQVLAVDSATGSQARDRSNLDATRQDAYNNPDATAIASEQRVVGTKLLSSAINAVEKLLGELEGDLEGEAALRIGQRERRLVVRVIDRKTSRAIHELSAADFLDMVTAAERQIHGLFVDEHQ